MAAARLQVIGMTCDFAGPMPATRLHSDRPRFDCVDRTGHEFFMMRDALEYCARRPRSTVASATCASNELNHLDDVHCVCACG